MINLKKGNSISLEKDGKNLENIYIGLNWGKISKYWGLSQVPVDLDGSISMFDENSNTIDTVYYAKRRSDDRGVFHSGDDRSGDSLADDKDNEVIGIDLKRVSPEIKTIVVYLNSYTGQQFHTIPYAKIRVMDRSKSGENNVFATFNLSSEKGFEGKVSMIMAKIVRSGSNWRFVTVGEAVATRNIKETVELIRQHYL